MQQMPCAHFVCCLPRHVHHLLVDPCARFVGALAAKGDREPAQSDGGAIRALADTIRNEEVDLIQRVQACVSSCLLFNLQAKVHVNLHAKVPEISFAGASVFKLYH